MLSIVAPRLLKQEGILKTKTMGIKVRHGRTILSLVGLDVTLCLRDEKVMQHCRLLDTDALDIVIGTDFLGRNSQVELLSPLRPYALHCSSTVAFCRSL